MALQNPVVFNIKIDEETRDAITELAARNDRTVAAETRIALREHLKSNGPVDPGPGKTDRAATKGR